jgi:bifunctional enzyme CysN/CysC
VAAGTVRVGDPVLVLPSGARSTVARIVTAQGDLERTSVGQPVTLTLADAIDVSRGDVICAADAPLQCADQFECTLVWLDDDAALPGRTYLLKLATTTVNAQITEIKYEVDIGSTRHLAARQLASNAIAVCNIGLDRPIPFDAYRQNPTLGAFILIDKLNQRTVGAGLLHFALRRSQTLQPQPFDVDKRVRSALKGQRPCVVWLTGLSGAGKSAIANALEARLVASGRHTYLLDGDNLRHRLNRDLGFDAPGRVENIRRAAEVARLMVDAGLIVIAAFISPFRAERDRARTLVAPDEFVEVHVDMPFEVAERRDRRGLYRRARLGELKHFPGISLPYEPPQQPEVHIDTTRLDTAAAADTILAALRARGVVAD